LIRIVVGSSARTGGRVRRVMRTARGTRGTRRERAPPWMNPWICRTYR